jgi:DNA-directed RNA polymerase beta' subunit
VDTAVKTAETGYMQRRLMKVLSCAAVWRRRESLTAAAGA